MSAMDRRARKRIEDSEGAIGPFPWAAARICIQDGDRKTYTRASQVGEDSRAS